MHLLIVTREEIRIVEQNVPLLSSLWSCGSRWYAISWPIKMCDYLQLHICNWCLCSSMPRPILVRTSRSLCSLWGSPGWRFEPELSGVCTLWRRGAQMEERETYREEPKVEKEKRCCDWQLSGPVPAEVVPPAGCYYQQKDFPIALAPTVSPLSLGGCYPIWEEMNRGPLTLYEVSADRGSTVE